MKHQVPESMKFKKLMRLLSSSKPLTAGLLELLWVATQKNAPRGDIGKFDNLSIAIECGWDGDADDFVSALIETGWLDEDDEFRLIVHDWKDHAPYYIKGVVAKQGGFACPSLKSSTIVEDYSHERNDIPVGNFSQEQRNLTKPNVTKRNLTKPNLNQRVVENSTVPHQRPIEFDDWWNSLKAITKRDKVKSQKKFNTFSDERLEALIRATANYERYIQMPDAPYAMNAYRFINGAFEDFGDAEADELIKQLEARQPPEKPQAGDRLIQQLEEQANPFAELFGNNQPQTIESPQNVKRLN